MRDLKHLKGKIAGTLAGFSVFGGIAFAIAEWGVKEYWARVDELDRLKEHAIYTKIDTSMDGVHSDVTQLRTEMQGFEERLTIELRYLRHSLAGSAKATTPAKVDDEDDEDEVDVTTITQPKPKNL